MFPLSFYLFCNNLFPTLNSGLQLQEKILENFGSVNIKTEKEKTLPLQRTTVTIY